MVDTGIGIEEEVRKKLFTPFSQADSSTARRFGGTGLGLTICKNLVELMHGKIELTSVLGQGTRAVFWIPFNKVSDSDRGSPLVDLSSIPDRLQSDVSVSCGTTTGNEGTTSPPLASPSAGARSMTSVAAPEDPLQISMEERKSIHVLVVEDNPINQQIALKTVKKLGFSVNAVWNGQEALDYLVKDPDAEHPRPDIILMDCQMPVMDGLQATKIIRNQKPYTSSEAIRNTPIVAMTASAIQGDKEKCEAVGMQDYLAKPVRGKVLEKMLLKWAVKSKQRRLSSASDVVQRSSAAAKAASRPKRIQKTSTETIVKASEAAGPALQPATSTSKFSSSPLKQRLNSSESQNTALVAELGRLQFESENAVAKSAETDAERVQRRLQLEEKALRLRDRKLLDVTDASRPHPDASEAPITASRKLNEHDDSADAGGGPRGVDAGPSHALTSENMSKYNAMREQHAEEDSRMSISIGSRGSKGSRAAQQKLASRRRKSADANEMIDPIAPADDEGGPSGTKKSATAQQRTPTRPAFPTKQHQSEAAVSGRAARPSPPPTTQQQQPDS